LLPIDSGDPASPFAAEPTPNGGFANLGAFGNTAQASKSAPVYLRVTRPNGGESWAARQTFNVLWRSDNPNTGLADIDLLHRGPNGTLTLQATLATGTANDGKFEWLIPDTIPAASDYVIRVTRQGGAGTSDTSDATFTIGAATSVYYVNDATVQAGDWTTTPGDDNNDGRTPTNPRRRWRRCWRLTRWGPAT